MFIQLFQTSSTLLDSTKNSVVIYYMDFNTHSIRTPPTTIGIATSIALVTAVMLLGITVSGSTLRAADAGLCGDGTVDADEQCDDGNLKNGDGCSGECTIETCGNGIVDPSEQCDSAADNGTSGEPCSLTCMILFCGDGVVDAGNGEECDDGNNVGGDGCSASCESENVHSAAAEQASSSMSDASSVESTSSASSLSLPSPLPPAASSSSAVPVRRTLPAPPPPAPVQPALPPVQVQAVPVLQFLASPEGVALQESLSVEERQALLSLIEKLTKGERISPEERVLVATLSQKLEQIKVAERNTYIDLLREFISTDISSEVVSEENMKKDRLTGSEVRTVIAELAAKATVIPAADIPVTVAREVTGLETLGITVQGLPSDYDKRLTEERSPLEVFSVVKSVKDATERLATTDLPASLENIRRQAGLLQEALPDLEREYNLRSSDLKPLLATIVTLAGSAQPQDREKLVDTATELMKTLSDADVISRGDIGSTVQPLHAAASAEKLAQKFAPAGSVTTRQDAVAFVRSLARQAPDEYRTAFESGTEADQQQSLLSLLEENGRTATVLASLRRDGRTDFDERVLTLTADIRNIDNGEKTATECDDSVSDALTCIHALLADLEAAARSKSAVTRFVGTLQDYFGFGTD
ncbi:MAG: DUF4215 domain-containing protein [Candidatus Peribacteraceae bacterium]|nr:DUF4215 domain-containing protein [Candidatus Peribacteraceae bacterium]